MCAMWCCVVRVLLSARRIHSTKQVDEQLFGYLFLFAERQRVVHADDGATA